MTNYNKPYNAKRWDGHVARKREIRNVYKNFVEKSEGKKRLRRSKGRKELISEYILGKDVVWGSGQDSSGSG
jgi:hypothetical protein